MVPCRYICYRAGAVMCQNLLRQIVVATRVQKRDKGSKIRPCFDYREERLDRQVS
jgi:hypothetical protein